MKYFIIPLPDIGSTNHKGLAIIFDNSKKAFTGIIRLPSLRKISPSLRRSLRLEESNVSDFILKADLSHVREIRKEDFRKLAKDLIMQNYPPEYRIVMLQEKSVTVTTLRSDKSYVKILPLEKDFYIKQGELHRNITLGRKTGILPLSPEIKSLFRSKNLRFISKNFSYFAFLKNFQLKNYQCIFAGKQIYQLPSTLKNVVIFTSVAGSVLRRLGENLEFWSRGIKGFYWKHYYGKPDPKRIEKALRDSKPDIVIFRGHGFIHKGKICWQLENQLYTPEFMRNCVYIHLSCLEKTDTKKLHTLPAGLNLVPAEYFPDEDNYVLLKFFFTNLQNGVPVARAAEQFCSEDKFLLPVFQ